MDSKYIHNGNLNWPQVLKICDPPHPLFVREHSPNCRPFLDPRYIILHWTAGGPGHTSVDWCKNPESNVSYHFVICRNGDVVQMVSLDNVAWHAGKSEWKGQKDLNKNSIGIGLANWGPLRQDGTTGLFHPYNPKYKGSIIPPKSVYQERPEIEDSVYVYFERYTTPQFYSLGLIIHALCQSLPIVDVLGHSDVAPTRKIDPGPALDMELLKRFAMIARRL